MCKMVDETLCVYKVGSVELVFTAQIVYFIVTLFIISFKMFCSLEDRKYITEFLLVCVLRHGTPVIHQP